MAAAYAMRMKLAAAQRAVARRPYHYPYLLGAAPPGVSSDAAGVQLAVAQARARLAMVQRVAALRGQRPPAAPAQPAAQLAVVQARMKMAAAQRAIVARRPYGYPYVFAGDIPSADPREAARAQIAAVQARMKMAAAQQAALASSKAFPFGLAPAGLAQREAAMAMASAVQARMKMAAAQRTALIGGQRASSGIPAGGALPLATQLAATRMKVAAAQRAIAARRPYGYPYLPLPRGVSTPGAGQIEAKLAQVAAVQARLKMIAAQRAAFIRSQSAASAAGPAPSPATAQAKAADVQARMKLAAVKAIQAKVAAERQKSKRK
jgi:hypothetical protein